MKIRILPANDWDDNRVVAHAELLFEEGILEDLKLEGFTIWQNDRGRRTVSFPNRQYFVPDWEKRRRVLLTPTIEFAEEPLTKEILMSYAEVITQQQTGQGD